MKHVFAIDFDGVICDTAAETAVTAWRAGSQIWKSWNEPEPLSEHLNRFVRLRPILETGYEAVILMHLIVNGIDDHTISTRFHSLCELFIRKEKLSVDQLIGLFGSTRDQWIQQDMEDWLSRHRFYEGILERLREQCAHEAVYIVTTKQERFVKALLQYGQIDPDSLEIFGLDRRKPKSEILVELMKRHDSSLLSFHFIEDRLKTLIRIAENPSLAAVHLYLADWGYNTEADRTAAEANPRIICIPREEFLNI